jgi:ABC-type amino acid transport substrate-binding protein
MKSIKLLALLMAIVMLAGVFAACGPKENPDQGETPGGENGEFVADGKDYTYKTATTALGSCWNPHAWDTNADNSMLGYVSSPFVDMSILDSENGVYQWVYEMATSVTDVTAANKADLAKYQSTADLAGKKACVEGGSAGAATAADFTDADKIFKATSQIAAFPELKSGAVDFIVCDIVLARNLCGEGGNYTDLAIVEGIELDSEIYAVGFRKGSDLTAKVNAAIKELEANGKLLEIATKYGFENVLSVTETIE